MKLRCCSCLSLKPAEAFSLARAYSRGRQYQCRACNTSYVARRRSNVGRRSRARGAPLDARVWPREKSAWKWPWVSRRLLDAATQLTVDALDAADNWRRDALELDAALRRERLRADRAEGELRWRDERIRRVLGLPGFTTEEEKKSA